MGFFKKAWNSARDFSEDVGKKTWEGIKIGANETKNLSEDVGKKAWEGIKIGANETKNLSEDVGKKAWEGLKTGANETKNLSEDVWEGAQKVAKELILPIVPIAENKILEMDPVDPGPHRDGHADSQTRPPSVSASTAESDESRTPGRPGHGTDSIRIDGNGSNGSNRIFTDQGVWLFIPHQFMDGEASETSSDLSRLRPSNAGPQSDSASVFDLSHEFDMAQRMAGLSEQVASDSASSTGYSVVTSVPSTEGSWLVSR